MALEIEAKILNIDKDDLIKRLSSIGAKKIGEYKMSSTSFDVSDEYLYKNNALLRLRTDGIKTTITYKKKSTNGDVEEIETTVGDYATMYSIFKKLQMIEVFQREQRREIWKKDDVEFDVDEWPKLNPYLEVESDSWEKVDAAVLALGFSLDQKVVCSSSEVYKMEGIIDRDYKKITFTEWVKK